MPRGGTSGPGGSHFANLLPRPCAFSFGWMRSMHSITPATRTFGTDPTSPYFGMGGTSIPSAANGARALELAGKLYFESGSSLARVRTVPRASSCPIPSAVGERCGDSARILPSEMRTLIPPWPTFKPQGICLFPHVHSTPLNLGSPFAVDKCINLSLNSGDPW